MGLKARSACVRLFAPDGDATYNEAEQQQSRCNEMMAAGGCPHLIEKMTAKPKSMNGVLGTRECIASRCRRGSAGR
jgi:hypothetical protein